jgi:hypothetical protein
MSNFERFGFLFEVTACTIIKTKIRFANDGAPGIYCPKERESDRDGRKKRVG